MVNDKVSLKAVLASSTLIKQIERTFPEKSKG